MPSRLEKNAARVLAGVGAALALVIPSPANAARIYHVVRSGDTLSEIAAHYDVTMSDIRQWNRLRSGVLQIGQRLAIGDEEDDDSTSYTVAEADTLSCIAVRFGVTVDDLLRWNSGLDADHIRAGEELAIRSEGSSRSGAPSPGPRSIHTVSQGETLSEIAQQLEVTTEELVEWNEGLSPDRIQVGQRLIVQSPFRITHRVRRGETVASIARRYGARTAEVIGWNRGVRPDRLGVGDELVIHRRRPPSESVGGAACGRLVDGVRLERHPGYVLRNRDRSWGTEETVDHIMSAFDAVAAAHPGAPRTRVHDISRRGGGPMDDHRSHQSGRDVDIIYFQRRCRGGVCPFRTVRPRELDADVQWTLLRHWLENGHAELIFIDYSLQRPLYEAARRAGATRRQLSRWFQYPRSRSDHVGIIRHIRNHANHVHVRFVCPEGDDTCQ